MIEALTWWLTVELIGAIAFPIGFLFFRFLPDRGYSFSKVLGLLLMGYLLWIGATAHVIPNARWSIILVLALLGVVSLALAARSRGEIGGFLQMRWRHLLVMEGVFTISFLAALFLVSYIPELSNGERPMNNAFINAVLRADYFPPKDPWLSGNSVAYYYFGHLELAALTKLVAIPSRITFNLSAGLLAALAVSSAFGLVYNFLASGGRTRVVVFFFALLGAAFVTLWGNLIGVFELLAAHGVGSEGFYRLVDIHGLDQARNSSEWYPTEPFWVSRAATFPAGVVDRQFPFFRYVVGEMHAQEMARPVVLMTMAMALNFWRSARVLDLRFWRDHPFLLALSGLVIGGLTFIHPWELPSVAFLILVVAVIKNSLEPGRLTARAASDGLLFVLPLLLLAVALYLPYYLLNSGSVPSLALVEAAGRSPELPLSAMVTLPHHLTYMWLPFLWLAGSLLVLVLVRSRGWTPNQLVAIVPAVAPLALWAVLLSFQDGVGGLMEEVAERGSNWITLVVLMSLLALVCFAVLTHLDRGGRRDVDEVPLFPLAMIGIAVLLIFGGELFFADDESPGFLGERFNTVLKAGLQAWVLLAVAGALALYYIVSSWRAQGLRQQALRFGWFGVTGVILSASMVYPVAATFWTTNSFDDPRSLDGLTMLRRFDSEQYESIEWLWENVEGTPVILEAPVPDYRFFGGISALTGLPTLVGWPLHEVVWRGSAESLAGREEAANRAYTSLSLAVVQAILEQHEVQYVYAGPRERALYGEAAVSKFGGFMDVVFQNADVVIYKAR